MKRLVVALCAATAVGAAWPGEGPSLAPEMLVRPVPGGFLVACRSEELLDRLVGHAINREKTKFDGMFDAMDCVQIPERETYKLLSVRPTAVEFKNVKSKGANGMWTVIEAMQPIK